MKITKLEHSGLAIKQNGKVLVFDPVEFTDQLPGFTGVVGIIITHLHNDHCQPDKIAEILKTNPNAKIFTTEDNAENLSVSLSNLLPKANIALAKNNEDNGNVDNTDTVIDTTTGTTANTTANPDPENPTPEIIIAHPGETVQIGNFNLQFFGGNHASIMPGQVPCQNLGVVIDKKIVNPGDSFDVSGIDTEGKVLLAPIAAPWCKISEVANFVHDAKPAIVIPVHDAVLSSLGLGYSTAHIATVCKTIDAKFEALTPEQSVEI